MHSVAWDHTDAVRLRSEMAAEVGPRYADRTSIAVRDGVNAIDPADVLATLLAYAGAALAGHAVVRWNAADLEVKRMFVRPQHRGSGVAPLLLAAAETTARAAGRPRLVLQTGDRQPDAVRFYERSGYQRIPVFPPYDQLPWARCYAKQLDTYFENAGTKLAT